MLDKYLTNIFELHNVILIKTCLVGYLTQIKKRKKKVLDSFCILICIQLRNKRLLHEVRSELVDESAEGQSISERGAHVADGHISVSLALILAPLLKRLDSRHPLQKPSLSAKPHGRESLLNNRKRKKKKSFVRRNNGAWKKMSGERHGGKSQWKSDKSWSGYMSCN